MDFTMSSKVISIVQLRFDLPRKEQRIEPVEEIKVETPLVVEECKVEPEQGKPIIIEPQIKEIKAQPAQKLVVKAPTPVPKEEFKLKLKLPGMSQRDKGFISDIFQEALHAHLVIKIPNCHWCYKIFPMTMSRENSGTDFRYYIPLDYAQQASPEVLKRGLLEKIEFRQNDKYLSAIKLTFNNGIAEQ